MKNSLLATTMMALFPSVASAAPLTVVIDPGHGGSNTGAAARVPGRYEKQVTLAIARALEARLTAEGWRVVLTRDRDEYLTLRERSRRANAAHPDLFVSVHCNASPDRGRHGIETYVLSSDSVDLEARRAVEHERDTAPVDALLDELRLLDAHRASMRLARAVQARLVATAQTQNRGVRQAGYDVLAGLTAPAILVEVGFLDHPIEGPRLLDPEVQRRLADGIAEGIFDFAAGLKPRYAVR